MRKTSFILGAVATVVSLPALAQDIVRSPTQAAQEAGAFWTPERMANAIPMDIVLTPSPNAMLVKAAVGATGPAGLLPGTPPTAAGIGETFTPMIKPTTDQVKALLPKNNGTLAPTDYTPVPMDGAFPGPNNTYPYGPKYRSYPISTVGKLFFTINGSGFVCSATVIDASTIWTAGHCVANGGASTWYSNWQFCPSYDASQGGPNPALGCWNGTGASTTTAWFASRAWPRDYAVVYLSSTGTKLAQTVGSVTGTLGIAWNWARDQAWHHYGYPAAAPWTGGQLIATTTEHRYDDPASGTPAPNGWGSGQTGGSSGSAVLLFFSYSGAYINSNVSYTYTGGPNGNETGKMLYGPYFDTTACNNYRTFRGLSGTC